MDKTTGRTSGKSLLKKEVLREERLLLETVGQWFGIDQSSHSIELIRTGFATVRVPGL